MPYVEYLSQKNYNVWIDVQRIKAGQNWDFQIKQALNKADLIVLFLSNQAVDRRGYLQREIKLALDKHQEKLLSDIYLIPVLLDDITNVPEQISSIQHVQAWNSRNFEVIDDAIQHQFKTISAQEKSSQEKSLVKWTRHDHKEIWDGLPGYTIDLSLINLESEEYKNINEASAYFNALIREQAAQERAAKFRQLPDLFSFGSERTSRTNNFDAYCSDPVIASRVISLACTVTFYMAGAAHPNTYFLTEAFFLEPLVRLRGLKDIFANEGAGLKILTNISREQLLKNFRERYDNKDFLMDTEWVERGTADWDCFKSFVLAERGVEILFPPYQVASYAEGPQFGFVGYEHVVDHLRPEVAAALGLTFGYGGHPAWLSDLISRKANSENAAK